MHQYRIVKWITRPHTRMKTQDVLKRTMFRSHDLNQERSTRRAQLAEIVDVLKTRDPVLLNVHLFPIDINTWECHSPSLPRRPLKTLDIWLSESESSVGGLNNV